jgi:TRAP transporter TAXI family solute receptor
MPSTETTTAPAQQEQSVAEPTEAPVAVSTEPLNVDIRFGTSSSGGTWYTLGMGLATIWNEKLADKGINVFAQATGGGQENAQMMGTNEIEMCFLGSLLANYVYNGENDFTQNTNLRSVTALQQAGIQWVIMKDDAKTGNYKDVAGMRFALNNPGASAGLNYEVVTKALGDLNVQAEYLNPSAAAEAMKNGTLRGGAFDGGAPTSALLDLYSTSNIKVQLLSFSQADIDAMNTVTPGVWFLGTISADTYGMDSDVTIPMYRDGLIVDKNVSAEAVYQILCATYDNLEEVKAVHAGNSVISLENALTGLSIPLHAGAVRFYQERGIDIPDYLIPDECK